MSGDIGVDAVDPAEHVREQEFATELGHLESLSKAVELKDIGWALAGIAVDAVGIVVQLCA
jgi:hypothetical protein